VQILAYPCSIFDGFFSVESPVYPANTSKVIYTTDRVIQCTPTLLIRIQQVGNVNVPFTITTSIVSDTTDFTPGQAPVILSVATGPATLKFNVGGANVTGESIIVQARGQSSSYGNHPFELTVTRADTCDDISVVCPGDSEPCFLEVPHEIQGYRGTWFLEIDGGMGVPESVWVNISLGLDNCANVPLSRTDFCADQGVSQTSIFGGFFGIQALDFVPNLSTNVFSALPEGSAACTSAAKTFVCKSVYRSCDANGWVPLDSDLCIECNNFVDACADVGLCFPPTPCAGTCSVEGSGTATATATGGNTGTGTSSSSASSLLSFVDLLQ